VFDPAHPNTFNPRNLPPNYRFRVVVKFRDGFRVPPIESGPAVAEASTVAVRETPRPEPGRTGQAPVEPNWGRLREQFRGATVSRMLSLSAAQIEDLRGRAQRNAGGATVPDPSQLYAVSVPSGVNPAAIQTALQRWNGVEKAYVEGPPVPPPAVNAADDPRSSNDSQQQGYLNVAPGGIDARYAWTMPGGDGQGVGFVDMEQGWTLNHEDLDAAHITIISGVNQAYPGHGTAVLGEVVATDNQLGIVGIAPAARARVVSEWRTATQHNRADAIWSALVHMNAGDVLLLEAQTTVASGSGAWSSYLPIEVEFANWLAIRVATLVGIVVVEAGGNGSNDLDAWRHPSDGYILRRGHAQYRESGAIMVGAACATPPHPRLGFSNYGSRIDCYAWGEAIMTTGDGWQGTARNSYTLFGGTSGASPIITGAAIATQGMARARTGAPLSPTQVLRALTDPRSSTPSARPATDKIGVMPDLRRVYANAIATLPARARTPARPPMGDFPTPRSDVRVAGVAAYLDPGHGGNADAGRSSAYGGRGSSGTAEKDVTLRLAERVRTHLGGNAAMSRDGDYNRSLAARTADAQRSQAPVYLSIHANTGRRDVSGPEVWVYGDPGKGVDSRSRELAACLREELEVAYGGAVPVNVGALAVLAPHRHAAGVGAALVEADSLASAEGEARLMDAGYIDRIGGAIARGVERYLNAGHADLIGNPAYPAAQPEPVWGGAPVSGAHPDDYRSV
jgi:N-acetylmuramoyl-L-alanine amidase